MDALMLLENVIMRLDKYLKVSRLIKRRSVANEACDQGRIQLNGKVAKAGAEVKEGDEITLTFGERQSKVRICSVQEHAAKGDASQMYEVI